MTLPTLTAVELHKRSKTLELRYDNNEHYELSSEYLRVYSPSAEVKGHGPGQERLQTGKQTVGILSLEAVGNYALKFTFDDGHDSGIYTFACLYDLASNFESHWQDYLQRLKTAGASRDPDLQVVKIGL